MNAQTITKRHIESHGYTCIIQSGLMFILMPFSYLVEGKTKRGHQIVRVTNLRDAYIKMGY